MKVKIVIQDWEKDGRRVVGEESLELDRHHLHGGTTFDAELTITGEPYTEKHIKAMWEKHRASIVVSVEPVDG